MYNYLINYKAPENTYFVCGLVDYPEGAYFSSFKNPHNGRK
jgi:hypothetical protein